jgi:hypothetical protein
MDDLHAHSSGCPSLIVRAESAICSYLAAERMTDMVTVGGVRAKQAEPQAAVGIDNESRH